MYRYAASHAKSIFINTDDDILCGLIPDGSKLIKYKTSDFKGFTGQNALLSFEYKGNLVQTHLYGLYNLPNLAFAISAGDFFEVALQDILDAISAYQPDNNRSQLIRSGSNTIIKDAYNANPTSMTLSIENFAKTEGSNKVLVLGDMLELGEYSHEEHKRIVELTEHLGFEESYFIGQHFFALKDESKGYFFSDVNEARETFISKNYTDATILLKGSRGIAVEKILLKQ
jgi:UDP-N-acetylmuramoyl-tripeptide--D-alanyl-D-alanine ligase